MALGFNSQPVNFNIDYSGNQVGQHYGNALANTGGMLGNSIMQFAKTSAEKRKKDQEEQAAISFLTKAGMMSPEAAKDYVRAEGPKSINEKIQLDLHMNTLMQRAEENRARADAFAAKAAAAEQENKDIAAGFLGSKIQAPPVVQKMGPVDDAAPSTSMSGGYDPDRFMALANGKVDSRKIRDIVGSINATNKANKPEKPPFKPELVDLPGGRKAMTNSAGSASLVPQTPTKEEPQAKPVVMPDGSKWTWLPGNRYLDENKKPVEWGGGPTKENLALQELQKLAGMTQAQANQPPPASPEDEAALKWLKENEKSPKAEGVRQRLKAKGLIQ